MSKPIIAIVGGTGAQGGGVVDALLERGHFAVRVLTRNTDSDKARALAARGVELVPADLNDASTLPAAFAGAYGAFVVTNVWDPATGIPDSEESGVTESEQGAAAWPPFGRRGGHERNSSPPAARDAMSTIGVGLVGADASGKGWGAVAHLPALAAVLRC